MESKEVTTLVVIDLSVAFDTVGHDILMSVLCNHFTITSNAFSWLDAYLHPRQSYVNVEGHKSSTQTPQLLIPQGEL